MKRIGRPIHGGVRGFPKAPAFTFGSEKLPGFEEFLPLRHESPWKEEN
jgi:hypothetical protein